MSVESIVVNACVCVAPRDSEYLSALSRYPRERDWPDVRVVTFRRMIYSDYWYQKRLKSSLYSKEVWSVGKGCWRPK